MLCEMILKYPTENWDWGELSQNKFIPLEFINDNINLPWKFTTFWFAGYGPLHFQKNLIHREDLTLEFVKKHINKQWEWRVLFKKKIITENFLRECVNGKYKLNDCMGIGKSDPTKIHIVPLKHFSYYINDNCHLKISPEFYKELHDKHDINLYCHREDHKTKELPNKENNCGEKKIEYTEQFIYENIDSLNCANLSSHPNINFDIVFNNWYLGWDWSVLTGNYSILLNDILMYPKIPWDPNVLFKRKDITMEFYEEFDGVENKHKYLNHIINNSHYFTLEFGIQHCKKNKKNWRNISKNKYITIHDINDNLKLPWNWEFIWLNPNIDREFIYKHKDKINFNSLSCYGCNT